MNILKHIWHFLFTFEYRACCWYTINVGLFHWPQRRVIIARQCAAILRQNIVNANGYSGLMIPNLTTLIEFSDDDLWRLNFAFNYFDEKAKLDVVQAAVQTGKIVVLLYEP